jgi:hypothetical protein
MYDKELTETSKGALIELMLALGTYTNDMVLVGGWPPYFLTCKHFDHCGSIDLDFVLKPEIMPKYESIKQIITKLDYIETLNIFRFEKEITSNKAKRKFQIHLDFLTEPEAKQYLTAAPLLEVQKDLKACLISGSSIVFEFHYHEPITAVIPENGEAHYDVPIADVVGSLTMKGQALLGRFKDKDYYDVYAVTGFHNGDPKKAAETFSGTLKQRGTKIQHPLISSSLSIIKRSFEKATSVGPFMVSQFIGDRSLETDSYERVSAFIELLETEYHVRL